MYIFTQLQSYALHRNSVLDRGFDASSESGYSVFLFNANNPSDFCILDEVLKFSRMRILLNSSFVTLEAASVIAIPLLMASIYKEFKKKMTRGSKWPNMRYFVWASILVIFVLNVAPFVFNILAIYNALSKPTSFKDIHVAFIIFAFALVVIPLLDFAVVFGVMYRYNFIENKGHEGSWSKVNCLCTDCHGEYEEIPNAENNQNGNRANKMWTACNYIFHFVSILAVTLFIQFSLFNVSMAAIAAPVEVGSLLLYYLTSILCFIGFLAIILKVLTRSIQECLPSRFCSFTLLLILLSIILLAGIILFGVFLYYYTILNQEYRNSRGILSFLGSLLPSLIAASATIFWKQVIPCVAIGKIEEHNEHQDEDAIAGAI